MSTYAPDLWVIVEIHVHETDEVVQKVFASWFGGYLGSDRWKMSSGVTEIIDQENHYEIHNHSGSIYNCGKNNQGISGYASGVLEDMKEKLKGIATITVLDERK